ncbi:MAG: NUDIX domain-containing protein [Planctomycetota bacterium]|nr:MAG: NUDIX domain-containing protein [Planctomycetota bacterium]
MKQSSGTLLYRQAEHGLEVLLVHPSGNYNRRAAWSIPKGVPDEGESLEDAARRETLEETGITAGPLVPLGFVVYRKSGKRVHAFAGPCDDSEPACTSWEVDRAEFVPLETARRTLHADQCELIDRLEALLAAQ